jgi:hypothetical protein
MLLEGIHIKLAASTRMRAQLGTPSTRGDHTTGIYPVLAPKECTVPFLVWLQLIGETTTSFDGANRLQSGRFRFKCYATSALGAKKLAEALKQELLGFYGTLTDSEQTQVEGCWLVLESDVMEEEVRGTLYTTSLDFLIHFVDMGA